jgi:hypothetical protein
MPDGRCVLTTADPRKAACEVQGPGYQWEPTFEVCLPPGLTQPAQTGLAAAIAQAACAAMGGQWLASAGQCQTPNATYGLEDFVSAAAAPGTCPNGQVKTPEGCLPPAGAAAVESGDVKIWFVIGGLAVSAYVLGKVFA